MTSSPGPDVKKSATLIFIHSDWIKRFEQPIRMHKPNVP